MEVQTDIYMRNQLFERKRRLESAIRTTTDSRHLSHLLEEVDSALGRVEGGSYGLCEECHDPIEPERLLADPLLRFCLDHLTQGERAALQDDLDLAARVQNALLPKRHVTVRGWEFAYHYEPVGPVSGDYCDLVIPDGTSDGIFFLVGDVAGKGVAASMLMAHLHAMFRSLIAVGLPLVQLMERANHLFCESAMAGSYATLVCGRAEQSGKIEISNAGHCPPLLLTDGAVKPIGAVGLPIGMFCTADYSSQTFELKQGDGLLLYTDGLSEASNRSQVSYGTQRLSTLLQSNGILVPRTVIDACLKDVVAFSEGVPRTDDLTIMVASKG
ncbi:MAG: SpoIIE family protein phosphatase [Acidobacteria bacterium]|nr:SpoIIE family protein phosphatase [Acidobacteriota bacterium]